MCSTTPAYSLTKYTYTGQYSYITPLWGMDDPTTTGITEGFGLMFYNARWYDPALGRFAQADTIVPSGVQGLDRYAYVNNSPLNYIDPSGHDGDCPPLLEGLCDLAKKIANWWEDVKRSQCSMSITPCYSAPLSTNDAIRQTAKTVAANNWGGFTSEQFQQLDRTLNTIDRVLAINNMLRSFTGRGDFSNIEGADPSEIESVVPLDWTLTRDPFYDSNGNLIDQWVYTSPNGQEQLRLHEPIPGFGGTSWQARWGNQVDKNVFDYLGSDWVQSFTNQDGKVEYWIYFDTNGNITPVRHDDGHIPIKNWKNIYEK